MVNHLAQLSQEHDANNGRVVELKNVQSTESERLQTLYAQQEEKEKEVNISIQERQKLLEKLNAKTIQLHELRHSMEALKHDIHRMQMDQHGWELKKQNAQQRLQEAYQVTFEDVAKEYASVAVDEEEVSRLKRRIELIGAVNLAAPEEYTALEERYNFLLTQQQDLLKAKEDLHQVINKINHTTRENFKITFDAVREHFKTIYKQLFEGGEADLVLTDEHNLLESGVDIVAQPPGKKLQNIAVLSGGEKALTATALLFAFFKVKASPFCVLDEVDAPLDEANVGRFIAMVQSFSAQTQFLVITHNKRSMELADVLYGVTMEELGISKIISVRFQRETVAASA